MSEPVDEASPPRVVLVEEEKALEEAFEALWSAPRLAVDTESNTAHAYRGRVCVVQLCAAPSDAPADTVYILDVLALGVHPLLRRLFAGEGPLLVLHDVAFDARMLAREGMPLSRALDTALHARFVGKSHTGLGSLLEYYFGHSLDKSLQAWDWAARPFEPEHLSYLADDVRWLGRLASRLEQEVADAEVHEEVAEECRWALGAALADSKDQEPPWVQLKGAHLLGPAEQSVLRGLALVRDEEARARDVPPGQVVPGAALLAAAKAQARLEEPEALRFLLRLRHEEVTLLGELWRALLEGRAAGACPREELERLRLPRPPPPAELSFRKGRELALTSWRKGESGARRVDPQVVLPTHVLVELARRFPRSLQALEEVPGFGRVRVERYGAALLRVLAEAPTVPQ